MRFVSVYETFLYYCCLILTAHYILGGTFKKARLFSSFLAIVPLVLAALWGSNNLFQLLYTIFLLIQFLLIKFAFRKIQLAPVFFLYIFIYCANVFIISIIIPSASTGYAYIDLTVNTLTIILWLSLCLSKIRYRIQQIIAWIPKYMLILSALILLTATLLSALFFGAAYTQYHDIWSLFLRVALVLLLLAVCFILPVFILTAISSKRLKTLTVNYEKQIYAQAENYKELAKANYDSRVFKHDFKNIRIAIEKLLADGENEKALQLIRKCSNKLEHPDGSRLFF